jgi:hypothetical protein
MLSRRAFVAGCAAWGVVYPAEARAADGALGHLDHSSWVVSDGAAGIAAFRKLGFTLTPKPKVQVGGALSTFALFPQNGKGAWLAFGPENSWTGETHSATSES